MFSSSVAGGSVCLGCQLRAVTRRAAPVLAAAAHAQTIHTASTTRRRQHGSEATWEGGSEDALVAALKQQAHGAGPRSRSRSRHASRRTEPQDDWDSPPSGEHHERHTTKSAQTEDELAAILKQQVHREAARTRHASRRSAPEDDWDLPAKGREYTKREAAESTPQDSWDRPAERREYTRREATKSMPQDDWDLVDEQVVRKPAHSRWGTPPPEALEDDEITAQEEHGNFRKIHSRDTFTDDNDESLIEELAKYRESEPRKYRKGRTKLIEDLPKLPVETLGKEAEIIVLREGGDWFTRPFKEDERPADPGLSLDDYADQDVGIGLDEIMENLDELRTEHRIMPSREFRNVFDTLMKGFTSYQLEIYVERYLTRLEEGDETPLLGVVPDVFKALPWIREQSVWTPEVKDAVQEVDHPLKGYVLKSMRPKQRLVMQLMRECWGMSVQELMDGQGMLEVRVRDQEFKLLTLGSQRFLQTISRVHLSQGGGKSIQVIKSRKSIRIVAPKVVAEACLKAMDETLQKMKTKTFQMDKVPTKHLNAEILVELGKITNSIVELNEARKEVEVTWIDIRNEPGSKLEDLADVVFRLLLTAYPPSRTDRALTVYPEVEGKGKGKLIEDVGSSDKLSWIDRRMKWARLCLPLSTEPPQVSTSWPFDQASAMKYAVQTTDEHPDLPTLTVKPKKSPHSSLGGVPLWFPRPSKTPEQREQKQTQPTPSGWLPFRVRTNAVFGHVLNVNDAALASSINEGDDGLSASSRTLAPLIPPIDEMDLPSWVPYSSPHYMTSVIVMRFKPDPPDPAKPEDALAPHLELRLKATDDDIIGIDSLRAVAHTHISDILLPAEHVDVRITQKVIAELPGTQVDAVDGMQPLLQFLRDARLEMAKGRLVTPPRLHDLGLPRWMFYRPEADPASPFMPTPARRKLEKTATATAVPSVAPHDSDEALPPYEEQRYAVAFNVLRRTSYVFAGLELRRPLETTYDGWRLTYTSVEAGQGGGRRAELGLEAAPGGDRELGRSAADISAQRFVRSVYRLARGADANFLVRPSDGAEVRSSIGWVGKAPKL